MTKISYVNCAEFCADGYMCVWPATVYSRYYRWYIFKLKTVVDEF